MRIRWPRAALTAFLALYGIVLLRDPSSGMILNSLDLAIHETGHIVFTPFGQTMHFLGGTLFQLIVPGVFVVEFIRREDPHAASVCLWWVAQNCWNISVYAADARAQDLPLVGGGEHDWAYLLSRAGWMAQDTQIARAIHLLGVLLFLASIVWGASRVRVAAEAAEVIAEAEPSGGVAG